jgi:hypothetical protein
VLSCRATRTQRIEGEEFGEQLLFGWQLLLGVEVFKVTETRLTSTVLLWYNRSPWTAHSSRPFLCVALRTLTTDSGETTLYA